MSKLTVSPIVLLVAVLGVAHFWRNGRVAFGADARRLLSTPASSPEDEFLRAQLRLERSVIISLLLLVGLLALPLVAWSANADLEIVLLSFLPSVISGLVAIVLNVVIGFRGGFPREAVRRRSR